MHFNWNEQTIRWFKAASAYTGFHEKLAKKIVPYLESGGTLCDVGCGLGRLDLELSEYVAELTAVDINENALSVLRSDAESSGAGNIRIVTGDASAFDGILDTVLLSFFGQTNMLDFLQLCRSRLIRVVSAEAKSGLYPERHRRNNKDTVPIVCGELDAKGIKYNLERHALEFGQPLRSWRDAEQYVLHNAPDASAEEINDFLRKNIENTGRDDFPFYLPNQKELGIFVIDKEK